MRKVLCFFLFTFSLWAEKTDVLFHLHDAGETFALLPVIRKLQVDYLVLTTGVAVDLAAEGGIPPERVRAWSDLEQIEPKEVITGVANPLQGAVLDYFEQKGIPTLAYWDNFNADGPSPYFSIARDVASRAQVLLLPCESLVPAFPNRDVRVVGQPTLERPIPKKVALWIGGYGEEYEEAFRLFEEGAALMEDVTFIMQHHPKTGIKNQLTFQQALSCADLVICHQSTAAFQALAAQIPVLHLIPPSQTFTSLPLEKGLAKRVSSAAEFPSAVREAMQTPVEGFFELMGIPEHSTQCCVEAVLERLP